jgi:hypothetical protein
MPTPVIDATSLGDLLQQDGNTTFTLGLLYVVSSIFALRRLLYLWRRTSTSPSSLPPRALKPPSSSPPPPQQQQQQPLSQQQLQQQQRQQRRRRLDVGKLFVASVFFACFVRSLSCCTLAAMAFMNVTTTTSSSDQGGGGSPPAAAPRTQEQEFYHRVLAILFNVGDWAAISTYLLLVVVWVELLQTTRSHFFSQAKTRRDWLIAYIVLNTLLYMVQIGLYVAVFLTPDNPDSLLRTIYAVIAFLNLAVPCMLALTWSAYFCIFAGFPFRSARAREAWRRISRLVVGWTVGRLLWAGAAISSADNLLVSAVDATGNWLFTVIVVSLFVIAELVPFLASLGTSVLETFTLVTSAAWGEEEEGEEEEGEEEEEGGKGDEEGRSGHDDSGAEEDDVGLGGFRHADTPFSSSSRATTPLLRGEGRAGRDMPLPPPSSSSSFVAASSVLVDVGREGGDGGQHLPAPPTASAPPGRRAGSGSGGALLLSSSPSATSQSPPRGTIDSPVEGTAAPVVGSSESGAGVSRGKRVGWVDGDASGAGEAAAVVMSPVVVASPRVITSAGIGPARAGVGIARGSVRSER